MYFDFEDYRPDAPRIPTPITIREAVLASVVVHLVVVIAYLVTPEEWFARAEVIAAAPIVESSPERPLRFVEVLPLNDRLARPDRPADASDMDRRSATPEPRPEAIDPLPFMRGNTPEPIVGGPSGTPPAPPPAPPQVAESALGVSDREAVVTLPPRPVQPSGPPAARTLGDALRDPGQYLRAETFDNPHGGDAEQSADIQFDSMGVPFGPWLLRFRRQVERNWLIPQAVFIQRQYERVVVHYVVQRNGYITGLRVLEAASIPALTNASLNAIRLSSPLPALPIEYPRDEMPMTVTFHYNIDRRQPR